MKNILITGTGGFIGKKLLQYLDALGKYNIILITSKPVEKYKYVLYSNSFSDYDIYSAGSKSLSEPKIVDTVPKIWGGGIIVL